MATLTNTKIKDTYKSLLKVSDNGNLEASLQEITDGEGNASGVQLNTGGDLTASGTVAFGSLKDSGENITITKFVDEADGIGSNDNDTSIPTSAAVKDYVDTKVTAEDLDFAGDSGTGSVDLDSQTFTIAGTSNEVVTSASGQTVTIGLPSSISVDVVGDLTGNVTATSVLADGVTATTQDTSDNSTKVATTAFVKSIVTAEDLDFAGDSGTGAVDLDSQTFTIAGTANEIETSASGQTITIGLPSTITANVTGDVTGDLTGSVLTAAQTNITSVGTLSSLDVSGNLTVDTNTLYVDAASNNVGIGTSPDSDAELHVYRNGNPARVRIEREFNPQLDLESLNGYAQIGTLNNFPLAVQTNGSEAMRIDTSGNVGIGASNPSDKLVVIGDIATTATMKFTGNSSAPAAGAFVHRPASNELALGTASTERIRIDSSGNVGIGTDSPSATLDVNGSLSKNSGSFKIDHPLEEKKDSHYLVHSFVESPQANNIYRGKVQLINGSAIVNLDEVSTMTEGTFVALNRDIHTYTSNESDWDAVRGSVEGNILTIECQNAQSTATVSWLVIGERHDQHMYDTSWTDENGKVIVEPLKQIEE